MPTSKVSALASLIILGFWFPMGRSWAVVANSCSALFMNQTEIEQQETLAWTYYAAVDGRRLSLRLKAQITN